jgi:Family of unknown function (DUF6492)
MPPPTPITSLQHAILPIAANAGRGEGDLARAALLLETLATGWQGTVPLTVTVVSRDADAAAVRTALTAGGNVAVRHFSESDFFPKASAFFQMSGWWKQQLIKLKAPAELRMGPYLTLDADIICCTPFAEATFLHEGRLVGHWEHKNTQDWWQNLARLQGCAVDPMSYGLSVTPNILHSSLAAQALRSIAASEARALRRLLGWHQSTRGKTPWTEYSLYTLAAERAGNLFEYHLPPDKVFQLSLRVHGNINVWSLEDAQHLESIAPEELTGHFMVIQSTAGVPLARVRRFVERILPRRCALRESRCSCRVPTDTAPASLDVSR